MLWRNCGRKTLLFLKICGSSIIGLPPAAQTRNMSAWSSGRMRGGSRWGLGGHGQCICVLCVTVCLSGCLSVRLQSSHAELMMMESRKAGLLGRAESLKRSATQLPATFHRQIHSLTHTWQQLEVPHTHTHAGLHINLCHKSVWSVILTLYQTLGIDESAWLELSCTILEKMKISLELRSRFCRNFIFRNKYLFTLIVRHKRTE